MGGLVEGWRLLLVALALVALLLFVRRRHVDSRLSSFEAANGDVDEMEDEEHQGILSVMENAKARIRTGSSLEQAFREASGDGVMVTGAALPSRGQLRTLLVRSLDGDETVDQADQAAAELDLACKVSHELGYGALRCLDAVSASYKRNRMMRTLRGNAFAMPKSTVKLLSALPFATLVLGEFMGANSLAFLVGTGVGRICFLLGSCVYGIGLMWMRAMMREMEDVAKAFTVPVPSG
ncbi:hypothetical protein [Bifidobacterium sp. ESL0790]|uniref:type II secretion system F family protein n=1 Tax=Bifidobacterium sp. ESL0790 TaxID=2983233 RepID=UPI0023F8D7EA|nr:hypothetical protein [Bifidobacterium sp. ESL0790]WEV72692.1 hypothetical protein OZY47_01535 [Bifidobacterium sp. ESL0790]